MLSVRSPIRASSGFTLIEVLVSVLVLLVGVLGVVGMQMLSLQANQGALFRSQAVYIGSEILDAMRANPLAAANYAGQYPDDGTGTSTVPADPGCTGDLGCTPAQAAQRDLHFWSMHFADVDNMLGADFRPTIPGGRARDHGQRGRVLGAGELDRAPVRRHGRDGRLRHALRRARGGHADRGDDAVMTRGYRRTVARAQGGLSLIELMVALLIGAFLVLGVVTVFLANRDSARLETSLARLQENGRFALDLMGEDLHRAQYLGCNTGDVFLINMIDDPNGAGFTPTLEGIRGYERLGSGTWGAAPPSTDLSAAITAADTAGGARNGSDVLSVRMNDLIGPEDPNDPLLTGLVLPSSTNVGIDDNPECRIEQNSRVVLTGCNLTAHLFQVSNTQTCNAGSPPNATTLEFDNTANFTTTISTTYDTDSQLLLFEEAVWFIADTGRDRGAFDVWALYRETNGVRQEMIEGVEFMQVQFGQRVPGGNAIRYVDATDATLNTGTNWEGVISVRVALLMQGFELVREGDDTRSYLLLDEIVVDPATSASGQGGVHAGGPVQRNVFTKTVMLRNAPDF
jgi:type IV pilus assembly protein PilW